MNLFMARLSVMRYVVVSGALVLSLTSISAHAQSDSSPSPDQAVGLDVRQGGTLLSQAYVDAISDAYGDLSVFILNVAAGLDGVPKEPQSEQVFRDAFAKQMAATLPSLDLSDQQALAQLPQLRSSVQSAWNRLPDSQRAQIAELWRQSVQSQLPGVPCPLYDALARALSGG